MSLRVGKARRGIVYQLQPPMRNGSGRGASAVMLLLACNHAACVHEIDVHNEQSSSSPPV